MFLELSANPCLDLAQIRHLTFIRIGLQNLRNGLNVLVECELFLRGHWQVLRSTGTSQSYLAYFSPEKGDMLPGRSALKIAHSVFFCLLFMC
jgi:hypothetical protein